MPKLNMNIPHGLTQTEARDRLKGFLAKVKEHYGDKVSDLVETWRDTGLDYAFKAMGFNVKGKVEVEPSAVRVDADLPFAAMMFKGKIEQTIREQINKVLT